GDISGLFDDRRPAVVNLEFPSPRQPLVLSARCILGNPEVSGGSVHPPETCAGVDVHSFDFEIVIRSETGADVKDTANVGAHGGDIVGSLTSKVAEIVERGIRVFPPATTDQRRQFDILANPGCRAEPQRSTGAAFPEIVIGNSVRPEQVCLVCL